MTSKVYGGTIRAGKTDAFNQLDIISAFQAYGEFAYDRITEVRCIVKNPVTTSLLRHAP